jgi:hypothetical protein
MRKAGLPDRNRNSRFWRNTEPASDASGCLLLTRNGLSSPLIDQTHRIPNSSRRNSPGCVVMRVTGASWGVLKPLPDGHVISENQKSIRLVPFAKIFLFCSTPNHCKTHPSRPARGGVSRGRHGRWVGMQWTQAALAARKRGSMMTRFAYGQAVWS